MWLVVPLALAAAEGLLALISEKGGKDHPGLLFHLTAPCLVWVPLAAGVRLLASRGFSKLRVLQVAAKALGAVLWGAVSVVVTCSWIVYRLTGSFLNLEQLAFAKENAGALLLHLLQTSGIYVLMGFGGCFLLSWATYSGISRLAPLQVTRLAHRVLLVAVFSLMFVAAIGVVLSGEWPTGPVAALAKGILQSEVMEGSPLSLPRGVCLREKHPPLPGDPPPKPGPPVIFVLVESLRFDLLERYPEAVPFLRRLSREATRFEKAYTPSTHSDYADLAIWYSVYPLRSGLRNSWRRDDPRRGVSLFGALKRAGYKTAYFSSQNERWGNMIEWLENHELDKFFHSENGSGATWENWDDLEGLASLIRAGVARAGKLEDSETLQASLRWIEAVGPNTLFAVGINLQNTHFSYVLPPDGKRPFGPDELDFPKVYYAWPKDKVEVVKRRYLNAVYNVDRLLEQWAERLMALDVWDRAVVVIAGDNGEAFYEHGFGNHSGPAYEECARVVAMLKTPGQKKGVVFPMPTNLVDLPATVVELATGAVPPSFQGVSVFAQGAKRPEVYVHVHAFVVQDAVVDWPWKLLRTFSPRENLELYDLEEDPRELSNLAGVRTDVTAALLEKLDHFRKVQLAYNLSPANFSRYWPPRFTSDERCVPGGSPPR